MPNIAKGANCVDLVIIVDSTLGRNNNKKYVNYGVADINMRFMDNLEHYSRSKLLFASPLSGDQDIDPDVNPGEFYPVEEFNKMITPISSGNNYFRKELQKRSNISGAINLNAALEYAERSLNAAESMYGDRRNKPVVIVFADNPRNFNSPVPFSRANNRIDYFLVTTRSDGGLDMVASAEENKIQLEWWWDLTKQFDLSKPVKIINRDQEWKCMDPNAAPTTPTTTVTTTTTPRTTSTVQPEPECPAWMKQWTYSSLGNVILSSESDNNDENIFLADCLQKQINSISRDTRRRRQLEPESIEPEIKLTFRFEDSRGENVNNGKLFKSSTGVIWSYKAADPEKRETAFELEVWLSDEEVSHIHINEAEKIMNSPEFCSVNRADLALNGASFNTAEFHLVDYTLILETPLSDSNAEKLRNFFKTILAVERFPNEIVLREVLSDSGEKLANLRAILERKGCTLDRCSNGCCIEDIIDVAKKTGPSANNWQDTLNTAALNSSYSLTRDSFTDRFVNERAVIYLSGDQNWECEFQDATSLLYSTKKLDIIDMNDFSLNMLYSKYLQNAPRFEKFVKGSPNRSVSPNVIDINNPSAIQCSSADNQKLEVIADSDIDEKEAKFYNNFFQQFEEDIFDDIKNKFGGYEDILGTC
jgi:hypothetical protein